MYTTFTTQVGLANRLTNTECEFAVVAAGSIDGENVFVCAEPDDTAFRDYGFTTIGQRFKVLGPASRCRSA